MKLSPVIPLLLLALAGCARLPSDVVASKAPPKAVPDPSSATTLDPQDPTPALLWSGLIGIRLGRDATGNGLPFFMIDEYEADGEEKIRELPNPMALEISINGNDLSPSLGSDYRQTLDFRTSVLTTAWTQRISSGDVQVSCRTVIPHGLKTISQTWEFRVPSGSRAKLNMSGFASTGLSLAKKNPGGFWLEWEFGPSGRKAMLGLDLQGDWEGAWSYGNGAAIWNGQMLGSEPLKFSRRVVFDPNFRKRSKPESIADIEIDGPVEDQQAVRSFLYYLRSAVNELGEMSIAPMGLSSTKYNGHVFWDADVWVFPVLALLDPNAAAAIPRYRLNRTRQAIRNYRDWIDAGRPIGNGKLGSLANADVPANGMMFPWESSVSGKETQPSEFKYQHHISGSVAFALGQAVALGLADRDAMQNVIDGVAHFYRLRTERNHDGALSLNSTMSPDESTFVDNDLYTNLVAQWCLNGGNFSNRKGVSALNLPRDEKSFLTYDNDHEISYKQAAAVLAIYPLQFPEAEQQARAMMERFEPKVPSNGPAMSDSIHALIWARLGENERAYREWRASWEEFTNHPLLVFTEKRVESESYFVTGSAGCLQTVIYGFLGFRIDDMPQPGAWSLPLRNGKVLSIKPNLPPAWKKATFRNFRILGKGYTLEASRDKVSVLETR